MLSNTNPKDLPDLDRVVDLSLDQIQTTVVDWLKAVATAFLATTPANKAIYYSDTVIEGCEYFGVNVLVLDDGNDPTAFTSVWVRLVLVWGNRDYMVWYRHDTSVAATVSSINQLFDLDKLLKLMVEKAAIYTPDPIPETAVIVLKEPA